MTDVSYTLNVSSSGDSVIAQDLIHDGTDIVNVSLDNTNLIEVVFSDMGEVAETLKFKFKIDADNQLQ